MSHTQIASLLLGFILIFQRASSSQFHGIPPWYCPGWNFTRWEHDIVDLRHIFKYSLSIQKECLIFLVQITLKIDRFVCLFVCLLLLLFFCTERYIVDTLASQRTWPILSVIRCSCITFNSVRRRIYVGGPRGVRQVLTNLQSGRPPFFFIFRPPHFFLLFSVQCVSLYWVGQSVGLKNKLKEKSQEVSE